jgi:hypothetical protein
MHTETLSDKPKPRRRGLSGLLCIPVVLMGVCWFVLFSYPMLGFRESLTPLFAGLELLSWGGIIAAITYFVASPKTWDVVLCLLVNLSGAALNIYGSFFGLGMVVRAIS